MALSSLRETVRPPHPGPNSFVPLRGAQRALRAAVPILSSVWPGKGRQGWHEVHALQGLFLSGRFDSDGAEAENPA